MGEERAGGRALAALGLLLALAAGLRFWDLGDQSIWIDESLTAHAASGSFPQAITRVVSGGFESNPPAYYALLWLWTQVFGDDEAGLRSLSAVAGTATVGVAWLLGRRLGRDLGAVAAAVVVATSPMLVWYSQEARSYALFVLLAMVSVLLALRLRDGTSSTRGAAWAAVCVTLVLTHYYGAFFVLLELAVLLRLRSVSAAWAATAVAGVVAAAAMAASQLGTTHWLEVSPILGRTKSLLALMLTSTPPNESPAGSLLPALVFAAAVALVAVNRRRVNRLVWALAPAAAVLVGLPYLAAAVGVDSVTPRNFLPVYALALVALGAALAAARPVPVAVVLAAIVAVNAVSVAGIYSGAVRPRDDWRTAVAEIPRVCGTQALVLIQFGRFPVRYYDQRFEVANGVVLPDDVQLVRIYRDKRTSAPLVQEGYALHAAVRTDIADHYSIRPLRRVPLEAGIYKRWINRPQDQDVDILVRRNDPPCSER